MDRFGRIDALVSNAGIAFMGTTVSVSEDEWNRVLDVP